MWVTCALLTALAVTPSDASTLSLKNPRVTTGLLGPTRSDAKFMIGDKCWISYDIDGLTVSDTGKAKYGVTVQFLDSKDKVIFENGPQNVEVDLVLGGTSTPAVANVDIGNQTALGTYTLKVLVSDLTSKNKAELKQPFEVVKREFGIVQPQMAYAGTPLPAPMTLVKGQVLSVMGLLVGFERDKDKNPKVSVGFRVLEGGQQTTKKYEFREIREASGDFIDLQWVANLSRPGTFVIEMMAKDVLTDKTAKVTFPITVVEPK